MDGTLILEGIVGSTAYGLTRPGSDVDRLGVFVAPLDAVLGLDGPAVIAGKKASVVTHAPDRTVHELSKFLNLAVACNPTIMELLWLDRWSTQTYEGELLVGLRRDVLSAARVRDAFGGYAVGQARRLVRRNSEGKAGFAADLGPRTAKHGRHCARLLLTGRALLATGELVVDVSAHRDYLFSMGELAETDADAFLQKFEVALADLDEAAGQSVLPERPDRDRVSRVLLEIRRGLG